MTIETLNSCVKTVNCRFVAVFSPCFRHDSSMILAIFFSKTRRNFGHFGRDFFASDVVRILAVTRLYFCNIAMPLLHVIADATADVVVTGRR